VKDKVFWVLAFVVFLVFAFLIDEPQNPSFLPSTAIRVLLAANLTLFLFLLNKFVGQPINETLKTRGEDVKAELADARKKLVEADALRSEVRERLTKVEAEVTEIQERAEALGKTEAEKIDTQAREDEARFMRRVDDQIARRQAETRELGLEVMAREAELKALRSQIDPHFLFNSLSSLVTLIGKDPERATEFVHKLSDVYRYVLEQRENELVSVSEELKFLEDYIYLQKIRFGENLRVHLNVKIDQNRLMVPLSLQMMVENAIKHNEVSAENPLVIELDSTGDARIIIRNRLQKTEVIEYSPGTGIENLRKRISFFTDEPLLVQEESGVFQVTIPTIPS